MEPLTPQQFDASERRALIQETREVLEFATSEEITTTGVSYEEAADGALLALYRDHTGTVVSCYEVHVVLGARRFELAPRIGEA